MFGMAQDYVQSRNLSVCLPRPDLFSAPATLYEAYTGKPYLEPKPNESAMELLRAAARGPFDRSLKSPALRAWFARALDPGPERRFSSAAVMRAALPEEAFP
jgi:serine/threonine protein kinase